MRRTLKILTRLIFVGTIVVLGYLILFKTNFFLVDNITIVGNTYVPYEEALEAAGIDHGENIFTVNAGNSVELLKKHPRIRLAKVKKKYPKTIEIEIVEREPLVVLEYSSKYLVLDRELIVLEAGSNEDALYIINGIEFNNFTVGKKIDIDNTKILENTISLIELIEKSHIEFMPMILIKDDIVELMVTEKFRAKFGKGNNIEAKFNSFLDVYDDCRNVGIDTGLIDLRFKGVPIYKPFGE